MLRRLTDDGCQNIWIQHHSSNTNISYIKNFFLIPSSQLQNHLNSMIVDTNYIKHNNDIYKHKYFLDYFGNLYELKYWPKTKVAQKLYHTIPNFLKLVCNNIKSSDIKVYMNQLNGNGYHTMIQLLNLTMDSMKIMNIKLGHRLKLAKHLNIVNRWMQCNNKEYIHQQWNNYEHNTFYTFDIRHITDEPTNINHISYKKYGLILANQGIMMKAIRKQHYLCTQYKSLIVFGFIRIMYMNIYLKNIPAYLTRIVLNFFHCKIFINLI